MSSVQQLVIGLILGAVLGLLYARVQNMAPWVRRPAFSANEQELLALLREVEPKLRALDEVFANWPDAFGVLDEIVAQFKTNTGHSMRDILDRLEKAATVSATAAEKAVAASDASAAAVAHLSTVVTLGAATGLRIEEHAADVANDLRLTHERADAITEGAHGEAADAAMRSPETTENVSTTDSNGETYERS